MLLNLTGFSVNQPQSNAGREMICKTLINIDYMKVC